MVWSPSVLAEYSARSACVQVLEHLERRRHRLTTDDTKIADEIRQALLPLRKGYVEADLPRSYFDALETELVAAIPARWRAVAEPFTRAESADFGIWRGGDPLARLSYVFIGLVLGGLVVWAPFIPIWEKWFPFLLAVLSWWLPDVQRRWHRRRYAGELGAIVAQIDRAQRALDQHITIDELLPPGESLVDNRAEPKRLPRSEKETP